MTRALLHTPEPSSSPRSQPCHCFEIHPPGELSSPFHRAAEPEESEEHFRASQRRWLDNMERS